MSKKANRIEPRSYDKHINKSRNLVERFFARLKQFRRIATRYDKLDIRFEAFIFYRRYPDLAGLIVNTP